MKYKRDTVYSPDQSQSIRVINFWDSEGRHVMATFSWEETCTILKTLAANGCAYNFFHNNKHFKF